MYDFIKIRLKEIGKKQKELADCIGIEPPHLSAIFAGKRLIKADEIIPMATFLEMDIVDFMHLLSSSDTNLKNTPKINTVYRVGFVEAGVWTEAAELPRDEWQAVNYAMNDSLKGRNVFALGVRGNSMNKIFPPEKTTLICLSIEDYYDLNPDGVQNGDYVIAQRISADGKYEATVKRYNKLDDGTIILEAMSTDPRYTNIIVGSESCEYKIIAVVIDFQTKLKDL